MVIITETFLAEAVAEAAVSGFQTVRLIVTPTRPIFSQRSPEEIKSLADSSMENIVHLLRAPKDIIASEYKKNFLDSPKLSRAKPLFSLETSESDYIISHDDLDEINKVFYFKGLTDGLPIIPPTENRVKEMLRYTDRDPEELIALVAPKWGRATVEKIAINAVMAGCLPEYMPIIITAVDAMSEKKFNLYGIQATQNIVAPLAIINGPMVKELDINYGHNTFGQGWRANATIGRAIRLILVNIGGGIPGVLDMACHGQPGKYTYCIAENEDENPWNPLHVERGFGVDETTVTMISATAPSFIRSHGATNALELLTALAKGMSAEQNNNVYFRGEPLLVLAPATAYGIASEGYSKEDVKKYLFENARVKLDWMPKGFIEILRKNKSRYFLGGSIPETLPIADKPEEFVVIVAGGWGSGSCLFISSFQSRSVTKAVKFKDNKSVYSIRDFVKR